MKVVNDNRNELDILQKIEELKEQYDTVYWTRVNGTIYVYKPLGRRDHTEICAMDISEEAKKDEVINRTLLYPDDIDIGEMASGEFNKLFETVAENSFISDLKQRAAVTLFFRQEMYDVQNQITCIIREAFPNYEIEDIENWGIEKTAKYLSRAEWILQNLRGIDMNIEQSEEQLAKIINEDQQQPQQPVQQQVQNEPVKQADNIDEYKPKRKENALSLAELKRKYPEVDWGEDAVANSGIDALNEKVSTIPVALRTPGQ